jgi:capsular exopolysaccharide synthesis family protein
MSRIDDALKRAAGEPLGAVGIEPVPARTDESLARYPLEGTAVRRTVAKSDLAPGVLIAPGASRKHHFAPRDVETEAKLVTGQPGAAAIEQYRRLAATLHQLQTERGIKTLMITSALPREGKTLTASNLALTLSESYEFKVLLVDADLRRPSLHEIFRLPNTIGLSDGLRGDHGKLQLVEVSPYLSILPAGRPTSDPMAGLTSDRMKALLADAAGRYDWVILDTPPIGLLPDAQLLTGLTDGVLVVIGAGSTPYTLVQRVINELGQDCILGTVLNRVEETRVPTSNYLRDYYGPRGE